MIDETDVLVFRSLHQGDIGYPLSIEPRKSLREVARKLDIDELTVRSRLEKLRRQGFLKGWRMFVNPTLLGFQMVQVLLDYNGKELGTVIERLRGLPDVAAIIHHIGGSLWVVLVCESDELRDQDIKAIERLVRTKSITYLNIFFPPSRMKLTPTDIKVIASLSADPRKRYSDVAGELGLSGRTVRRRLGLLVEERALFVIPAMDPGALEGALMGDLLVEYSSTDSIPRVNHELLTRLDKYVVRAQLGDKRYAFFNLFITKVSAAEEILRTVSSIDGVKDARVDLVQGRVELFEHYYRGRPSLGRVAYAAKARHSKAISDFRPHM